MCWERYCLVRGAWGFLRVGEPPGSRGRSSGSSVLPLRGSRGSRQLERPSVAQLLEAKEGGAYVPPAGGAPCVVGVGGWRVGLDAGRRLDRCGYRPVPVMVSTVVSRIAPVAGSLAVTSRAPVWRANCTKNSVGEKRTKIRQVSPGASSSDRKSTRLNSSHANISYAVFCLTKKKTTKKTNPPKKQQLAPIYSLTKKKKN